MAMEVHGHLDRMIQYAAGDSGNGATGSATGQVISGTDNSGSQSLTAQERLEAAMADLAKAGKSKAHADRKITAQGQDTSRLRQELEAKDAEIAALKAAASNPGKPEASAARPQTDQQRFNQEMADKVNVLTNAAQHLLGASAAAKQDTDLTDSTREKVRAIYGTTLEPKYEDYLVDARKTGDPDTIIEADRNVREAMIVGATESSQAAIAAQGGVGGSSGTASTSPGTASVSTPPSGELTEEDWSQIKADPLMANNREAQMAASMMLQLERLDTGTS
jgi:hypothetical protein